MAKNDREPVFPSTVPSEVSELVIIWHRFFERMDTSPLVNVRNLRVPSRPLNGNLNYACYNCTVVMKKIIIIFAF